MECQVCESPFKLSDNGNVQGRFTIVKSWNKNDEGNLVASFRSLDVHKDCVYDILEKAGVSLRKLI